MPDINFLRQAVEDSPEDVTLLLTYGGALLETGQPDEALATFVRVLELEPRQRDAQLGIAQALFQKGEVSEAAVRVEAILAEDNSCAGAHILLSLLHLAEHDRTRAIEEYLVAVSADRSLADGKLESVLGLQDCATAEKTASGERYTNNANYSNDTNPFSDYESCEDTDGPIESDEDLFAAPATPQLRFADICGHSEVKNELRRRWILPVENPVLARTYRMPVGAGVLLCGPPGCGKSMLAEAVAKEVGCKLIRASIHEILDPYFGSSERNLFQLMEMAREEAPVVISIDHIDTIAGNRHRVRDNQARNLANQFLHQLDLLTAGQDPVMVIGSTDMPWLIDRSFLRPGRLGQPVFVPPPDRSDRLAILHKLAASYPTEEIDLEQLASTTRGFSGADLKGIFEIAGQRALETAVSEERLHLLDQSTIAAARQLIAPSTTSWFELARKNIARIRQDEVFAGILRSVTENRRA
jgi:AAA+ superfamily predicted ATPase